MMMILLKFECFLVNQSYLAQFHDLFKNLSFAFCSNTFLLFNSGKMPVKHINETFSE